MRLSTLATCSLNQWALDFSGNLSRICESITQAREQQARYRVGPELETSGYGCEDHFHEPDTFTHSWESIATLIAEGYTDGILVDIGAPVLHRGVPYNARVLMVDRRVVLIRPKTDLADSGNYRESRWFRAWPRERGVEQYVLPDVIARVCDGEKYSWIGYGVVEMEDGVTVGCETCEELWTGDAPHVRMGLGGVDVIGNGSASHHVLRKMGDRVSLMEGATRTSGGVYLYANQMGCDGGRLFYDGGALAVVNGQVVREGRRFWVGGEVDVVVITVDLDAAVAYRLGKTSTSVQAAKGGGGMERLRVNGTFSLCAKDGVGKVTKVTRRKNYRAEEEIAYGPACWLWDYLRRSGMNGFFLALSGGADSSATAAIVGSMCQMLVKAVGEAEEGGRLLDEIRKVTGSEEGYVPIDARELAGRLLHTMYMGNAEMSSEETRARAKRVAGEIGAWHGDVNIDGIVEVVLKVFEGVFGERPRFEAYGGSRRENLALQCVQARVRMVIAYLFGQLLLWGRGRGGGLLVLGSANVDEGLRGYLTKYDCSSADLNPIGGVSKKDLKEFLKWAAGEEGLGYGGLVEVFEAVPTAELEPMVGGKVQTDEDDMGMTYDELGWFGRLRKLERCGPWSMYERLRDVWGETGIGVDKVAEKVKFFWKMYGINRHKMTVLTPSYHAEDYSPDDNRFDLRQFLYNSGWLWQFGKIDRDVKTRLEALERANGMEGELLTVSKTKRQ